MRKTIIIITLTLAVICLLASCEVHTHTFGEWETTKKPTCTTAGEQTRFCDCGETQTKSVIATEQHTYSGDFDATCEICGFTRKVDCNHSTMTILPAKAATCTETGLTEGKLCSYCHTVFVKQEVIPTLEHVYNTAYSFDNSFHWYACKNCGTKKDNAEHQAADNGMCSVCDMPIGATEGIIYDISADGTYAEVVAYKGTATKVRIADTYNGLPVMTIYDKAFYNNDIITSVIIPDSVTRIRESAFDDCNRLESVAIPDSVTSIGASAFRDCTSLTSVVIPDSMTIIGISAFLNCNRLTDVVIPDSVKTIGSTAFYGCDSLTSVVIPDSVTKIGDDAFAYCYNLQFNEYESCKYLGSKENPYCALIDVTTQNLSSCTIHVNTKVIANEAFSFCSRLTSIVIPDSVTSIGDYAFNSSLTSVVIGNGVTNIGNGAFLGCSSLTDVYYTGSQAEWKAITIGLYNYDLYGATIHYNYVPEN